MAQPFASVEPLKVPAPEPERPSPESGSSWPLVAVMIRLPWLGSSEAVEGATMLSIVTGVRLPFQVTVEVMRT